MTLHDLSPFFEIDPPERPRSGSGGKRWRSHVARNEDVVRWFTAVPVHLEKVHKRTANWTRGARYGELQSALARALPNLAIMAWIMRHPGSPADRFRAFLGECLGELAEIPKLAVASEARTMRVDAFRNRLGTAAAGQHYPIDVFANPYFGITERASARTAAIILAMLIWSEP